MKKLFFFLFLGCFISLSVTATGATIKKIATPKQTDLILKEGQNSIKIKIHDNKTIDNFVQKVNDQVAEQNSIFLICFVYVTDISYQEAMDGTMYAIVTLDIHCYGDPNSPLIVL